jgi:hypothetical protein
VVRADFWAGRGGGRCRFWLRASCYPGISSGSFAGLLVRRICCYFQYAPFGDNSTQMDFCFLRETHNKKLDVWSFARFGIVFPVSLFILYRVDFALESATGEKYGSRI